MSEPNGEVQKRIDVFPAERLPLANEMVTFKGEIVGVSEFRAAFMFQSDRLSQQLYPDAIEDLANQARRMEGDAVFTGPFIRREGIMAGVGHIGAVVVAYNPGVVSADVMERVATTDVERYRAAMARQRR